MAKYKKRKDGRYCSTVTIGRDENGVRKRKCIYGDTIRELEAQLADFKSLQNKGIVITDNKTTLAQWATEWLKVYRKGGAHNTREIYRNCIENHIVPTEQGAIPMIKIKPINLQDMVNSVLEEGHLRTAQILVQTLKMLFDQAVEDELIYKNPARKLKKPSYKTPPKRALTDIENKAIEKADLTLKERAFIYLGKYAGLRRGEILALTQGDIDLKASKVTVNKQVIFIKNEGIVSLVPKTDAGYRTVPMPEILRAHMEQYMASVDSLSLFLTRHDEVCSKTSYRRMWSLIVSKLNAAAGSKGDLKLITDLTAHILRHDYATSLYYAGVDIKTAQAYLGHNDIRTTLSTYTHLQKNDPTQGEKLDKYYGSQDVVKTDNIAE